MRTFMAIVVLAALATAAAPHNYKALFEGFKAKHGRVYATPAEEAQRFKTFVASVKEADRLNAQSKHATFGVTKYSDRTEAERQRLRHPMKSSVAAMRAKAQEVVFSNEDVQRAAGQTIDWRKKGAVTPVKNVGECSSGWAFSAVENIEGQWFIAGNTLVSLSEQQIVSCDTSDDGCNGGDMITVYEWLMETTNGAIFTAASMPYVSGTNGFVPACNTSGVVGATINGWQVVAQNETAMAAFVYKYGPLSIGAAASYAWESYTGGIMMRDECPASGEPNSAPLLVGFDDNHSPPYWIAKCARGSDWGEEGYIRIEKGVNACDIIQMSQSSLVKKN